MLTITKISEVLRAGNLIVVGLDERCRHVSEGKRHRKSTRVLIQESPRHFRLWDVLTSVSFLDIEISTYTYVPLTASAPTPVLSTQAT